MDKKNINDIECFVFDIDGTIALGQTMIKGADLLIDYLYKKDIPYYFFTNNSSKNPIMYVEKLNALGIKNKGISSIITSGDVTAKYILDNAKNPKVFLCATDALKKHFEGYGIDVVESYGEKIDYVVLGFDTELDFEKLTHLTNYLIDGVEYLATNIDDVCPLENDRFLIDCGSMAKMIGNATGRYPRFLGKPKKETADYIADKTNLERTKVAIVGDRLYTDIKTACDGGLISIAVLSGEMSQEDIDKSEIKPDFIFDSALEMYNELK